MIQEDNKGLSNLMIKPYAIEILLLLSEEGPKTDKEIIEILKVSDEDEIKIKHVLGEMRGFELIEHHGSIVYTTSYGERTIRKLRKDKKTEKR